MFASSKTRNSLFSKNVNLTSASTENQLIVSMYKKLSVVVQTINTLMTEYSKE